MMYYLVYGVLWLFSLLPMWVHYVIADGIYLIVYRLVGYRKKLVRKNLADSFPEKTKEELQAIEKGFYHWFCDYLVETIKMMTISEKNLKRRMVFKGVEGADEVLESGQSIALYLGHYCNWEWVTSMPLWVTPKAHCGQIYHVLENAAFDKLFLKLRERWGAESIPMAETLRRVATYRKQGQPIMIGYISDQVPFWNNIHHWLDFLNHDTPVLTGTERLARGAGHAIFYLDMHRVRRGYYEATLKLITRDPKQTKDYELTDAYFHLLEESIRRDPACYLWTHNRWKRTHEEFNLRYDETTGRVDITSSVEELRKEGVRRQESGDRSEE
jgi:KDO2-lipid IV(A) lauroyltransferase